MLEYFKHFSEETQQSAKRNIFQKYNNANSSQNYHIHNMQYQGKYKKTVITKVIDVPQAKFGWMLYKQAITFQLKSIFNVQNKFTIFLDYKTH